MEHIPMMMSLPMILTKDRDWVENCGGTKFQSGQIVVLPEDAVLVCFDKPYINIEEAK